MWKAAFLFLLCSCATIPLPEINTETVQQTDERIWNKDRELWWSLFLKSVRQDSVIHVSAGASKVHDRVTGEAVGYEGHLGLCVSLPVTWLPRLLHQRLEKLRREREAAKL